MSHSAPAAADAVTLAGNRPSLSVRIAWLLLALAAAINIVVAVVLATGDSRRASDLHTMYEWCRAWLIAGRSLYTGPNAVTDYPPHAIVWLAPIATVPRRWIVPLWTAMAVVLTPLLPWLVMRSAARRATGPMTIAIPVLLYLCWAAPRTLLQFSVLSLTLASLSALIADERPIVSGLTLGLALFKPHIAGPVALWMMISGRLRPILIAAAIVIGGLLLYDTRIGESPLTTALAWGSVIRSEYAGSDGFVGRTSIRGWAQLAAGNTATGDTIWIVSAALLLIALCATARRDRWRPLNAGGLAIPAMFSLWSLLAVYHNGNNLILMLPAFAFLWFRPDRPSPAWRWTPIAILELAMAFDVPVRFNGASFSIGWERVAVEQFDRIVVLATLAYVAAVWWRLTKRRANVR